MSSKTGKNALANLLGSLAIPLIGLVMAPFYLRQIGLEGLGIIGLMAIAHSVLGIFISGASKTIQRDLSHAVATNPEDLQGLALGGLALFGLIGTALATVVFLLANSRLSHFASGTSIAPDELKHCVILIPLFFGFGIINFYLSSILTALKDQIVPSALGVVIAVSVATTCWLVMSKYPRVDVFYLCQLIGILCSTLFMGLRCKSLIGRYSPLGPKTQVLDAWRARAGESGKLSLILVIHEGLGVLITQIDRAIITSLFPIKALGAYNLAANPARMSGIFSTPVTSATFPEMCAMVGKEESKEAIGEYLGRLIYVMAILLSCAMIILVPAAHVIMELWLGKNKVPEGTVDCFVILSIGHLLLGMAGPSYNLTVAFKRVGYGIPKNVIALILLPPFGYFAAQYWGIQGAALVWLLYCLGALIICTVMAFLRHASFVTGYRWIRASAITIISAIFSSMIIDYSNTTGMTLLFISLCSSVSFLLLNLSISFGPIPSRWLSILETNYLRN